MNARSTIQFDLASVPREIRDDLARPLALAVDAYFKQPGVEEKFQQWRGRRPSAWPLCL